MKVAITDACIFIDLYDLQLSPAFFKLDLEVHTSVDVFNELYPKQQQLLRAFQSVGKLTVHCLEETDRIAILTEGYPNSLSMVDKTVLHLAKKLDAMLLSGDKAVRKFAKRRAIDYHGMLWIFDQLIANQILSPTEGASKLKELINNNLIYQFSSELLTEVNARLKKWQ